MTGKGSSHGDLAADETGARVAIHAALRRTR